MIDVETDDLVEETVYSIRNDEAPTEIMNFFGNIFEFDSEEILYLFMDHLVPLIHHTGHWILKEHTPKS